MSITPGGLGGIGAVAGAGGICVSDCAGEGCSRAVTIVGALATVEAEWVTVLLGGELLMLWARRLGVLVPFVPLVS